VSSPANPICAVIVVVVGGVTSILLLLSGALVSRLGIEGGTANSGEEDFVLVLGPDICFGILGRILNLVCVGEGLREPSNNKLGVRSDSDDVTV
jgi:hypothetical protein